MAKNQHIQDGDWGEQVATEYLENLGYAVLFRNWRYKKAEVDIICVNQEKLVFVEVKYRKTDYFGEPENAISDEKIRKLQEAAEGFMDQYPKFDEILFDIISIVGPRKDAKLTHFKDAFFPFGE